MGVVVSRHAAAAAWGREGRIVWHFQRSRGIRMEIESTEESGLMGTQLKRRGAAVAANTYNLLQLDQRCIGLVDRGQDLAVPTRAGDEKTTKHPLIASTNNFRVSR